MDTKRSWPLFSQEKKVESLYSWGAKAYGESDWHGGFLSFGLWEDHASTYKEAAENLLMTVAERIDVNSDDVLLNPGCGLGGESVLLQKMYGCRKIEALDVAWVHVEAARQRVIENKMQYEINVSHGTATDLKFKNDSFDKLISIEAPCHFQTRFLFMKEAYRVLKPGGKLGLSDYLLSRPPCNFWERMLLRFVCWLWKGPISNAKGLYGYKSDLQASGFENIEIECVGEKVIPHYVRENQKPESRRAIRKIRGRLPELVGRIMDAMMLLAWKKGIVEYILVSAEKL